MNRSKKPKPQEVKRAKIQFRLNPYTKDGGKEKRALEIHERLSKNFEGDRALFTELLLASEGDALSSTVQAESMNAAFSLIMQKIDEQQAQMHALIVNALQSLDLSQFVNRDGRSVADAIGDRVPNGVYQAMMDNSQTQEFDVD